jgi:hypothetical protein
MPWSRCTIQYAVADDSRWESEGSDRAQLPVVKSSTAIERLVYSPGWHFRLLIVFPHPTALLCAVDDAINFALRIELAQTPFLRVLDEEKVREYMKELNQPIDGRITPDIRDSLITSRIVQSQNTYAL